MAETLVGPDGRALTLGDIDREFSAAMAAPEPTEPKAPAPPKLDNEAPYGRKADGTPRQKPAGPGRPAKPRTTARPSTPAKVTETAQEAAQRRLDGVSGLIQLGAGTCMALSARFGDPLKADAIVLASNADGTARACVQVAEQDARFAKVLDKITTAGPYGALVMVVVPMAMQIARNHGVNMPSTMSAAEVIKAAEEAQDASSATPEG